MCVNQQEMLFKGYQQKNPELISAKLNPWNLSSKEIKQVYKLAGKFLGFNDKRKQER